MSVFRQLESARIGGALGLRSERGIFCLEPIQKRPRLLRSRRDQADLRGRRQNRDGRRVNHLEEIKAKRMQRARGEQKTGDREFALARAFPAKEQTARRSRVTLRAHGCGVVASATEEIPRSRAAFVTAMTRS